MKYKNNQTAKNFLLLTLFSLFEKVVAFVYQATMAYVLGTSIVTDSYNVSSQLFDLIDTTVLGAMIIAIIQRFTIISKTKDEPEAFMFLSNVKSSLTLLMSFVSILFFIFADSLSHLIAPGFSNAERTNLILCIRFFCFLPPIMAIASVSQALLRLKKCFIAVNCRSLCISVCGMLVLLLFSRRHPDKVETLCIGYVVSNLMFTIILHFCGRRFGRIRFVVPTLFSELKELLITAFPTIISTGIIRLSLMIDQIIASNSGEGAISCLGYAQSLYHVVSKLLILNLCIILLTDFADLAIQNDFSGVCRKIKSSVSSILILLIPVTILTICFSNEIVEIAFQRGAFGSDSARRVATLLKFYAIGFIPTLINNVYSQVFYAYGKNKQAMYITAVSLGVNITLSIILSSMIGLAGIALGTSVSQIIAFFFYRVSVKKILPGYRYAIDSRYLLKMTIGLIPCVLIIILVKRFIDSAFIAFGLATILSFISLFTVLVILKEENTIGYLDIITKRLKKRYEKVDLKE